MRKAAAWLMLFQELSMRSLEINLPATCVSDLADAEAVHDEEQTEGAAEGDPLLGLIQMLRRTNINHK